jgi:hypothetical protein
MQSCFALLSKTKALAFVKDCFLVFTPSWSYLHLDLITYQILLPVYSLFVLSPKNTVTELPFIQKTEFSQHKKALPNE